MAFNVGALKKDAAGLKSGTGSFTQTTVQMPKGKGVVVVRFLDTPGMEFPYQKTRIHNLNNKNFHCPKVKGEDGWWHGKCPICDYYNLLWKNSKNKSPEEATADQNEARKIKPIERYYYNCIVRSELNIETGDTLYNVGPKILAVGKTLQEMILGEILGEDDEPGLGNVFDDKTGRDYKINKTIKQGAGMEYPEYTKSKFMEPSPLGTPEEIAKWMSTLHNLEALRVILPYDELMKQLRIHLGVIKDDSAGMTLEDVLGVAQPAPVATVSTVTVPTTTVVTPVQNLAADDDDASEDEGMVDEEFLKNLADC